MNRFLFLVLSVGISGCMDAETQARDIKHCQSVGQDYWYNGFNQVFCKPKNK